LDDENTDQGIEKENNSTALLNNSFGNFECHENKQKKNKLFSPILEDQKYQPLSEHKYYDIYKINDIDF